MCKLRIFLDDERFPPNDGKEWIIVRSYDKALEVLKIFTTCPFISFDNDLGPESLEGFQVAKWIVEHDLDLNGSFLPLDYKFYVHSQNSVRNVYIYNYINNYLKVKRSIK